MSKKTLFVIFCVAACILSGVFVVWQVFSARIALDQSKTALINQETKYEVPIETSQDLDTNQEKKQEVTTSTSQAPLTEHKRVTQAGVSVIIQRQGNLNYVVAEEGGEQYQLDSGEITLDESVDNIARLQVFSDIRLTPDGNYAMVRSTAWESGSHTIYDLREKKEVVTFFVADEADFTPDGKFAYACASSAFHGEYYGVVIKLTTGEQIYSVPVDQSNTGSYYPYTYSCSMKTDTVVVFIIKDENTGEIVKTFEYSVR